VALGLAFCICGGGLARAHVAPSPDANNRYLKITCLPDEIRFTYTAFFGERPGHALRARLDTDGDGVLGDEEKRRFGEGLRSEIAGAVDFEVDGEAQHAWKVEDVGLGTPTTAGGAFAVDLELSAKIRGAPSHELSLVDGWRVPTPGEMETRIEESPGVRVVSAHLLQESSGLLLRWAWPTEAADPRTRTIVATCLGPATPAPATRGGRAPARGSRTWLWIALGAVALGGGAAILVMRRRASYIAKG
jgi:hypothetical protein